MSGKVYTINSGDYTDSNGTVTKLKLITVDSRTFIVIDIVDMSLQGNFSDVEVGITNATGPQIVQLTNIRGNTFELDVTNPAVPTLVKKP